MAASAVQREADHDSRILVRLAFVGGLGAAWFVVAVLLLHVLKSADYDFAEQTLSEFAVGRYGFLMTSAFVALGVGELTLGVGLWKAVEGARFAPSLLFLGGLVDLTSAIFEADLTGAASTTHGAIHDGVGALGAVLVVPTLLSFAWRFRRDARWRSFALPTLVWALAAVGGFGLVIALGDQNQGLSQRVFIAVYVSWLLAVSVRLVRLGRSDFNARLSYRAPR